MPHLHHVFCDWGTSMGPKHSLAKGGDWVTSDEGWIQWRRIPVHLKIRHENLHGVHCRMTRAGSDTSKGLHAVFVPPALDPPSMLRHITLCVMNCPTLLL
uniref:Uncharacterized protein n=1 Tax=Physcomitrium patens TaxID=3218 RepID=A0A2K1K2Q8_PHYPA|nr:hypothetical protein PHYPA_012536 [Physcomitrium patens]